MSTRISVAGRDFSRRHDRRLAYTAELYHVGKIGVTMMINMAVAFLPLAMSEPIMNTLNPAMKRRPRIADYDPDTFHASQWDKDTARRKTEILKTAQEERKTTGRITVTLPVVDRATREVGV